MRRRLGWWLVVALLAGGCSTSTASQGAGSDQADVWFMQHMVPHLLQTTAMVDLAGDRITRPKLARLAATRALRYTRPRTPIGVVPAQRAVSAL